MPQRLEVIRLRTGTGTLPGSLEARGQGYVTIPPAVPLQGPPTYSVAILIHKGQGACCLAALCPQRPMGCSRKLGGWGCQLSWPASAWHRGFKLCLMGFSQEVIFPTILGEQAESMSPRVKKIPGHCYGRGPCQAGLSSDHCGHRSAAPEDGNHLLSWCLRREAQQPKASMGWILPSQKYTPMS